MLALCRSRWSTIVSMTTWGSARCSRCRDRPAAGHPRACARGSGSLRMTSSSGSRPWTTAGAMIDRALDVLVVALGLELPASRPPCSAIRPSTKTCRVGLDVVEDPGVVRDQQDALPRARNRSPLGDDLKASMSRPESAVEAHVGSAAPARDRGALSPPENPSDCACRTSGRGERPGRRDVLTQVRARRLAVEGGPRAGVERRRPAPRRGTAGQDSPAEPARRRSARTSAPSRVTERRVMSSGCPATGGRVDPARGALIAWVSPRVACAGSPGAGGVERDSVLDLEGALLGCLLVVCCDVTPSSRSSTGYVATGFGGSSVGLSVRWS